MSDSELYDGREQTLVKHYILEKYLFRLAVIVGRWSKGVNYVDCFSGPWNARGENYQDSSFGIALSELRKAREKLDKDGVALALRCFFLERDATAYTELNAFCKSAQDIEIVTKNGKLEESIDDILRFNNAHRSFPFLFIDPTGWTGFPLRTITPLLRLDPGEVVVNFMTWHARRFILSDQESRNFDDLYGDSDWRNEVAGLEADRRDDAMVRLYAQRIKAAGNYKFVCYTPILHREDNTTHFHLVYASRHEKGVEVFKDVERKAVEVMEQKRAAIQQKKRASDGQMFLFSAEQMHDSSYYSGLRSFYLEQAKGAVLRCLTPGNPLLYDEAWKLAMRYPLVWEQDLKDWVETWRQDGAIQLFGLDEGHKPQRKKNIRLARI